MNRHERLVTYLFTGLGLAFVSAILTTAQSRAEGLLPSFYSAGEIRATVADAGTGRPIESVVIVAVWELKSISGRGPRLEVSEAVTDPQGTFVIRGWGPKPRPPMTEFRSESPYLLVFKSGYAPVQLYNAPKADFARLRALTNLTADKINYRIPPGGNPLDTVQESLWNGMTIRIEPFQGTPEHWFRELRFIADAVAWQDAKYVKRFYKALGAEREYFNTHPVDERRVNLKSLFAEIERRLNSR